MRGICVMSSNCKTDAKQMEDKSQSKLHASRCLTIFRGCVSTTPYRRMMLGWSSDCMMVTSCRKSVSVSVCLDKLFLRDFTATGSWKEEREESLEQAGAN